MIERSHEVKRYKIGNMEPTSDGDVMIMAVTDDKAEFIGMFGNYESFTVSYTEIPVKGFSGYGRHRPTERNYPTPAYRAWTAMLAKRSIYYGVCDEWMNFQVFAEWYYRQIDRHGRKQSFKWSLSHLLIDPSNRDHDPIVCCVVPAPMVKLFNNPSGRNRELPLGVHYFGDRFIAFCSVFGKGQKHLGVFNTVTDARAAYWSAKCETVRQTAEHYRPWLPVFLADRLCSFDMETARIYYPDEFDS